MDTKKLKTVVLSKIIRPVNRIKNTIFSMVEPREILKHTTSYNALWTGLNELGKYRFCVKRWMHLIVKIGTPPHQSIVSFLCYKRKVICSKELANVVFNEENWEKYSSKDKLILEKDFLETVHFFGVFHSLELKKKRLDYKKNFTFDDAAKNILTAFLNRDLSSNIAKEVADLKNKSRLASQQELLEFAYLKALSIREKIELSKVTKGGK